MYALRVILLLGLIGLISADQCAVCNLVPNTNNEPGSPVLSGQVTFHQRTGESEVHVTVSAAGFTEMGYHGFHVHEFGNMSDGCESTGSHFNPDGNDHGAPTDVNRHAGDLGNVIAAPDGSVHAQITDSVISLEDGNEYNIMGRAIVVHADRDDLGRGGFDDSLTTGHAGARLACCIITPCA